MLCTSSAQIIISSCTNTLRNFSPAAPLPQEVLLLVHPVDVLLQRLPRHRHHAAVRAREPAPAVQVRRLHVVADPLQVGRGPAVPAGPTAGRRGRARRGIGLEGDEAGDGGVQLVRVRRRCHAVLEWRGLLRLWLLVGVEGATVAVVVVIIEVDVFDCVEVSSYA